MIAIEDQRFYTQRRRRPARHRPRARGQDILRKRAVQGASTITQQFVKNALNAQAHRTVFEKLREAALAYHLTRKWSKDKILTRVPQHDLLRQRRLRDRVGRAHLLRRSRRPPGLRHAAQPAAVREPPRRRALGGRAARRHDRLARAGYDPIAHPVAASDGATVLQQHARAGLPHALRVRRRASPSRCPPPRTIQPPQVDHE